MARSGVRIQVLLATDLADEVEAIAKSEGVSLSRVVGSIVEAHRTTDEYQRRLAVANTKLNAVRNTVLGAIEGANLSNEKVQAILKAIDELQA